MEDPSYVEYFSSILLGRPSKVSKNPSPPPKMQLKTEGQEPDNKYKAQYESFTRAAVARSRQDSQSSKVNLNRSMSQKGDSEIEEAKLKVKELETKLASILEENKVRKSLLRS
jgi:hypothetical protein